MNALADYVALTIATVLFVVLLAILLPLRIIFGICRWELRKTVLETPRKIKQFSRKWYGL